MEVLWVHTFKWVAWNKNTDRLATFCNFIEIIADPWTIWEVLRFRNLDMYIIFENKYPRMPFINVFLWDVLNYDWCKGVISKQ